MATHDVKTIKEAAVLIANNLRTGLTVYLTEQSTWTTSYENAWRLTDDATADKAMLHAARSEQNNEVVGAYLVDAETAGLPTHVRERLRVEGPSIKYLKD